MTNQWHTADNGDEPVKYADEQSLRQSFSPRGSHHGLTTRDVRGLDTLPGQ